MYGFGYFCEMVRISCKYLIFLIGFSCCKSKSELPVNEYDRVVSNPYTADPSSKDSLSIPILKVDTETIDFGQARQGDTIKCSYKLYNTGSNSLLISKVSSSCGCASPNLSKNTIPVGDSSQLSIIFTTQNIIGSQLKEFTIWANTNPSYKKLKLTGTIIK